MAPSPEPKESRAKEWKQSTWNPEHVTEIIASSSDMITIVGNQPDKFGKIFSASVHKELLCFFSSYYTAALKGGFSEAKKNTITIDLPYDQMKDLISWLYSGNIITCGNSSLLDLYLFADEKMMLAFRRSIMNRLVYFQEDFDDLYSWDTIPYLKSLPPSSGLFRYIVDCWVYLQSLSDGDLEDFDDDKQIPREFFHQALRTYATMNKAGTSTNSDTSRACLQLACNYHEHVNREEWLHSCHHAVEDLVPPKANSPSSRYYSGE